MNAGTQKVDFLGTCCGGDGSERVPPRFTIRDLLHEPRGDDDAFLTDESASISCCPGTLYRRGPLASQTAKVGFTIEDCLCFLTIILSLSKGPRVWPGTPAQ